MSSPTSKYILGIGTGRSGTASLAHLLSAQDGVQGGHERAPRIPWTPSDADRTRAIRWLKAQSGPITVDVAHSWISMVGYVATEVPVRWVGLVRDREETVDSFCRHMPKKYIQTDGPHGAAQFPTYDLPERKAWEAYVRQYHWQLILMREVQIGQVFPMTFLNTKPGQRRLLNAAGIEDSRHHYIDDCHLNATSTGDAKQ